jgi:hypothetical protein
MFQDRPNRRGSSSLQGAGSRRAHLGCCFIRSLADLLPGWAPRLARGLPREPVTTKLRVS